MYLGSSLWDLFLGTGLLCIYFATASTKWQEYLHKLTGCPSTVAYCCFAHWHFEAFLQLPCCFGVGPFFCAAVLFGIVEMEYTVDSQKVRNTLWHNNSCSSHLKNEITPPLLCAKTNFAPIFFCVRIQITSPEHMHGVRVLYWYSVSTLTLLKYFSTGCPKRHFLS